MYYFVTICLLFGLAIIPGKIAENKGYSFGGFYFFGLCFFFRLLSWLYALRTRRKQRLPMVTADINMPLRLVSPAHIGQTRGRPHILRPFPRLSVWKQRKRFMSEIAI